MLTACGDDHEALAILLVEASYEAATVGCADLWKGYRRGLLLCCLHGCILFLKATKKALLRPE